jgi:hypothetical protein
MQQSKMSYKQIRMYLRGYDNENIPTQSARRIANSSNNLPLTYDYYKIN